MVAKRSAVKSRRPAVSTRPVKTGAQKTGTPKAGAPKAVSKQSPTARTSTFATGAGARKSPPVPRAGAPRDPRVDAYIAKAPEFARPILAHLRAVVHASGPGIVETIKWGHPSFEYSGVLGNMAAFKAHCAFGFWKHELIVGDDAKALGAMGSFGSLRTLADLPSRAVLIRYVKKARVLNEQGVTAPRTKMARKKPIAMHPQFAAALKRNPKARAALEGFAPSHQREYLEWITDAKRDETRTRRIETAIEWLALGRKRNWKYEPC